MTYDGSSFHARHSTPPSARADSLETRPLVAEDAPLKDLRQFSQPYEQGAAHSLTGPSSAASAASAGFRV